MRGAMHIPVKKIEIRRKTMHTIGSERITRESFLQRAHEERAKAFRQFFAFRKKS
jgi:hypothetical protein